MTVVVAAAVVVVVVVVVLFVDNDEDDTLCEFDRHVFTRYALQFLYQLFQWSWVDASRLRDCEFATGQYSFISHLGSTLIAVHLSSRTKQSPFNESA